MLAKMCDSRLKNEATPTNLELKTSVQGGNQGFVILYVQ